MTNTLARILAVVNRKGGTGKTTVSTHIAAGLAIKGLRVGIVDLDTQAHVSDVLVMPDDNGLRRLLIDNAPLSECAYEVPPEHYSPPDHEVTGSLFLLPSGDQTWQIGLEMKPDDPYIVLRALTAFAEDYALDCIIIDTAPSASMLDAAVFLAVDGYIVVTQVARQSLQGMVEMVRQYEQSAKARSEYLGRDTRLVGIIPNMVRANVRLHRENAARLAEMYPGHVWGATLQRAIVEYAANEQQLLYTYAPTGEEVQDAWRWVDRTASALREMVDG